MSNLLNISSSPHARDQWTTAYIMRVVILALVPTTIIGWVVNGWYSVLMTVVSVATAVASEFVFNLICKKPNTIKDCSAVVTGLLLALSLPASVPLYIPFFGSLFAIVVAKCCFGGLGKNFINPALAGRCFVLLAFSMTVTTFKVDGVSAATPLAVLKNGDAVNVTKMFLGTAGGVLGSSVVAMMAGGLILWALDIIHGEICFSVIVGFLMIMGFFGGQGFDPRFLMAHLSGGGVIMGAFFMATDYTTSPVSRLGQLVYGCLIGALGGIFRCFGSAADSFSYAIIVGNLFTPLIDMFVIPKPYAYRKSMIALQNGEEKKPLSERLPKPVIVLAAITLIAGLALSGVFTMTKDTIEEQQAKKAMESYKEVLEGAEEFKVEEKIVPVLEGLKGQVYGTSFGRVYINNAATGYDSAGNVTGYVINVSNADGYDDTIELSMGILPDGTLTGISFTQLNETPGMGMLAKEDAFRTQFNNRKVDSFVLLKKGGSSTDEEIDSVSGASITSSAVVNAVNAGLDFFRTNFQEGGAE